MSNINLYTRFLDVKQSGRKTEAMALAQEIIAKYTESPDYNFVLDICARCEHKIDHIIWQKVVLPELESRIEQDTQAIKAMIQTIQNLYSSKLDHKRLDYITEEQLTIRLIKINPQDEWAKVRRIEQLRSWLAYTIHEWPSGVLYGVNGASIKECDEILAAVEDLRLSDSTGKSNGLCEEVKEKTSQYKEMLIENSF